MGERGNGESELGQPEPCPWCSGEEMAIFHAVACPRVTAIDYHENGKVKRVELSPMDDTLVLEEIEEKTPCAQT